MPVVRGVGTNFHVLDQLFNPDNVASNGAQLLDKSAHWSTVNCESMYMAHTHTISTLPHTRTHAHTAHTYTHTHTRPAHKGFRRTFVALFLIPLHSFPQEFKITPVLMKKIKPRHHYTVFTSDTPQPSAINRSVPKHHARYGTCNGEAHPASIISRGAMARRCAQLH